MRSRDLLPGERLLMTAHQHWVVLLRPFAVTILLALAVVVAAAIAPLPSDLKLFAVLGVLVIGLAALNVAYWRWHAQEYVLTDQRVILNEGLIATFSRSIAVDRIQDLTVYQGLLGRTCNFGDLEVESAGREGGEWLRLVPRPQQVRNVIFTQMESRRRTPGPA